MFKEWGRFPFESAQPANTLSKALGSMKGIAIHGQHVIADASKKRVGLSRLTGWI
jgi:hypothetical protein